MRKTKFYERILIVLGLIVFSTTTFSQDPNFYIYLCFGQSNMEGSSPAESQDMSGNSRFKVLEAVNCDNLGRVKGTWYTAVPPLCRCWSGITPSDYFGKTLIANLPDSISVGVINVSVAGCNIKLFDKDVYQDFYDTHAGEWFQNILKEYDENPYAHLIDLAKLAQQDGVIKGILLHQGETNTGDVNWPSYVKKIYNDMLTDLSLHADSVPLLAGEMFSGSGNCCSSMNPIINTLPDTIPTAHIISSAGCESVDEAHFTAEGYRILGRRYGVKMLSLMGYKSAYSEAECSTVGDNWRIMADNDASNGSYITSAPGMENLSAPPGDESGVMQMTVNLSIDTTYYVFGRFNNPSSSSDSYWIKVDNGDYELMDELTTTGWEWLKLKSYDLSAGDHTISIAFGENGGYLDKLVIKNSEIAPVGIGEEANNICEPEIYISGLEDINKYEGFALEQNYPNPFSERTSISFDIPITSYVSLKVFNLLGDEVAELGGKEFISGKHTCEFKSEELPAGHYYYTINTDRFSASRKMIMLTD